MSNSALLLLDLQNDICHEEGIFHKNGLDCTNFTKIIPNIVDMMFFCKEHHIPIIVVQHSVLEDMDKVGVGLGIYKKIIPFIQTEGLRENTWGHDLLDEIKNHVDYKIKRWTMSAFYHTELVRYLVALRINQLIIAGRTTNDIVETTAREAAARNYKTITISDCTASYSEKMHLASLTNINNFGQVISSKNFQDSFLEEKI
ncbi:MAG: Peroxyureidoacrylate/ureidoacrylate amidohydrolase RutB [Candidatus Anoxychlamydiales bacterium]|nr:Peroxyureidoacrylate/ureidoacrylate amidohydrolase RutB [Candidatus Anoxychlamydiales bacterium]NGX36514.1 Peroxyureidoacrylate/ureidoacrylate amidohydrolase RutB [Candidatus Anoxychlamydiales bacterium]